MARNDAKSASGITRVELIDHQVKDPGRQYVRYAAKGNRFDIELSYQDDGRTLKIFVKEIDVLQVSSDNKN
jgi:hypothetical protein